MSGLEAIGALSSVVQITDCCLQLVLLFHSCYRDACSASADIARCKVDVDYLVAIVQTIRDSPHLQTPLVTSSLSDISSHTQGLLNTLARITPTTSKRKIEQKWREFKFVFRKKDIESVFKALDRKTAALSLSIANIQAGDIQTVNSTVNLLGAKLDKIRGDQQRLVDTTFPDVSFNNLPLYKTTGFMGREPLLQQMSSTVNTQEVAVTTIILVGMGGSGKTQLALKYCQEQSINRNFIFWVDAESEQSVRRAYGVLVEELAARTSIEPISQESDAQIRYFLRVIGGLTTSWILVFDNYDDPASFQNLQSFIPGNSLSACGTVLITSRHPDVARLGGTMIEVGPMSEDEGVDLLLARASIPSSTESRNLATQITRRLGGLALAIDQVGTYLQKTKISLSEFSVHFETKKQQILTHIPSLWNYRRRQGEHDVESTLSVFTTWELSFHCLERSSKPAELEFTTLLGFFNYSSICDNLFRSYHNHYCLNQVSQGDNNLDHTASHGAKPRYSYSGPSSWCESFIDESGRWDYVSFRMFLSTLRDLSFIQGFYVINKNSCLLAIHPLVADWMKLRVDSCARMRFTIEAAKVCHSAIVSKELFRFSPKDKQDLLSHIDECLKNDEFLAGDYEGPDLCSWTNIVNSFADFNYSQGRFGRAGDLYEHLLRHESLVDPIYRAQISHSLATVHHCQGRYSEAESLYKEVLEQREAQLGRNHEDTLRTIECLANIYRSTARYSEAKDLYLEVLRELEIRHDQDNSDILQVVANLANNYRSECQYQEAESLYNRAFLGCQRTLGASHSTTITVINDFASNFQSQGQYSDAETLYRKALEGRILNLGNDHPDTLWTMADLANNLQSQSRYHEAETLYRSTVSSNEAVLGMDHPETLWALDGLANVVRQLRRYDEAQYLYKRVLQGREKRLGPNHHNTLRTVKGLGMVYTDQARHDEAEELYNRAITGFQKQFGPDHLKTLDVVRLLAETLYSKGEYLEANLHFTRALEGYKMRQGSNHPDTLKIICRLEALSFPLECQTQAQGP